MIEHRCFSCQFRVIVFVDPLWFEAFGSRPIVFRHERCRAIRQIYQSFLPTLDDSLFFVGKSRHSRARQCL